MTDCGRRLLEATPENRTPALEDPEDSEAHCSNALRMTTHLTMSSLNLHRGTLSLLSLLSSLLRNASVTDAPGQPLLLLIFKLGRQHFPGLVWELSLLGGTPVRPDG